ncbi:hypothetical protein U0035_16540 [Niabella yanshanensis]|uniref:DUF1080 domain-containing protein n=1 Tax=Niabella yanshanensis TaxID=577386 RepID=A0ABZ0W3H7_9BACT|nr:hypothetical protein [Niabella yanshanensis]WQD37279.1 hypothetical protein U0035_16540 [Niabella yanshanensis]
MKQLTLLLACTLAGLIAKSQSGKTMYSLQDTSQLKALNVTVQAGVLKHHQAIKVTDIDPQADTELRLVQPENAYFHNGTIEVELAGQPMKNASEGARGFVGIAFRIDSSNKEFECFYLRPSNGRAPDQVRRNHAAQYISYPEYPWYQLRKDFPEKYEAYVDLEVGIWTKVKIEVQDTIARLYVHGASQPTLIVSDLKHGSNAKGNVGLWIGPGTEAYFRNLVITKKD